MTATTAAEKRGLAERLAEAEATIAALLSGQVDAVVGKEDGTPVLLMAAQEALRESEMRFRQLAESIEQVFYLRDIETTKFFYISPSYAEIFGQSCESLYARPQSWGDVIHPDDRERVVRQVGPRGSSTPFDIEFRIVRPDGRERSIRSRGFPVCDEAGIVYRFAGIADDITERRALEAQVRQASKMDAIGRLASGVAHDFNNLLSVILGFAEVLAEDPTMTGERGDDLGEIVKAANQAAGLTAQLLAFGRQQVLQAAPVDINALITDAAVMLRRLIGENVKIVLQLAENLAPVLADRGQLEQVVMNLVVNARDAMPDGGTVTIATDSILVTESTLDGDAIAPGNYVLLTIADTGSGMTEDTQRRLFEPFFTTKDVGKGTGLGLSTTYGIIRQSKGHIAVSSELGRGTTFTVYLPQSRDAAP